MPIYKGSKEVENIMLGSKQVETIYKGTQEVWNNNTWYLYHLGTGTYFNINSLGVDVSKLTSDNFISLGQPTAKHGYCEKVYSVSTTSRVAYQMEKSFSGGYLNFYYRTYSRNTDEATAMDLYLISHQKITNATKVKFKNYISLGSGQTFDIKSKYSDYQNLTANNFYMISFNWTLFQDGPDVSGAGPVEGDGWIEKSYDSSTGTLTFRNKNSWNVNPGNINAVLIV